MNWVLDLIIIALFATAGVSAVLAVISWRRRSIPSAKMLAYLMIGVSIWSFFTALEYAQPTIALRTSIAPFQYFGSSFVPVLYLFFALDFTHNTGWLNRKSRILLLVIPALSVLLVFTNNFHHLNWTNFTPNPIGDSFLLVYEYGIGFWIFITYLYACMMVAFIILARHTIVLKGIPRQQGMIILIGSLFPWAGNFLYITKIFPIAGVDIAPIAFAITGLVLIWAVLRFQLLDLIPIARNTVIEKMSDGIIVLDANNNLVDINPMACKIINKSYKNIIGLPASEVFSGWEDYVANYAGKDEVTDEIILPDGSGRLIELRITRIKDEFARQEGVLIVLRDITRRRRMEYELEANARRLQRITDNMLDVIIELDSHKLIKYVSPSIKELTGYSPAEKINKSMTEFIHPDDCAICDAAIKKALQSGETRTVLTQEYRIKHKQRGYIWIEMVGHFMLDDAGQLESIITVNRDVTERKRIQDAEFKARRMAEALKEASIALNSTLQFDQVLKIVLEQARKVVAFDSASVLLLKNNEMVVMSTLGFSSSINLVGTSFSIDENSPNIQVIDSKKPVIVNDLRKKYRGFDEPHLQAVQSWMGIPLLHHNELIGILTFDDHQNNHFTNEDATMASAFADPVAVAIENSRLFACMEQLAITDTLTGLYTRRHFFTLAENEFERAQRYKRRMALLMLDIDHFKIVNDTYGHVIGDQVLRTLAVTCIQSILRKIDVAGRYGGEEFIILLPETSLEHARRVAGRICRKIENTIIPTSAGDIQVTASLGIAVMSSKHKTLNVLIQDTDAAMYQAKDNGRNQVAEVAKQQEDMTA